ncbi:hypothetical protein [Streptomyces huiliensis]|uniref:hypothetical protein n=1 Tax=Streptomyces huiliensis TaxID=2876027 RepID=UPI001CBBEE64|nr:hypothetical protein [Streptomyces huiliensis]MBZ4323079.1 hypothetical protein [Streptomyces huiliensis]
MARDRTAPAGGGDLLISAAVAEIEGLYTELHGGRGERHRDHVLADLAKAGRRLASAARAAQNAPAGEAARPRSRRERRRFLAARGADRWLTFAMGGGGRRRRLLRRGSRASAPGSRTT